MPVKMQIKNRIRCKSYERMTCCRLMLPEWSTQTLAALQPTQKVLHLKIQIPLHEIYNDNPELNYKT